MFQRNRHKSTSHDSDTVCAFKTCNCTWKTDSSRRLTQLLLHDWKLRLLPFVCKCCKAPGNRFCVQTPNPIDGKVRCWGQNKRRTQKGHCAYADGVPLEGGCLGNATLVWVVSWFGTNKRILTTWERPLQQTTETPTSKMQERLHFAIVTGTAGNWFLMKASNPLADESFKVHQKCNTGTTNNLILHPLFHFLPSAFSLVTSSTN